MEMSDSLLRQVALVSQSKLIDPGDLAAVSAALQKQATRDLPQFWDINATVDAFPRLEDVPIGYWPIILMDDIDVAGAAGVHEDKDGQPFALVTASNDHNVWSLTTSHEMIEMLIDPFGNRLIAGDSPKPEQGRVQILVEPCDPSEAADFAYTVNGVLVSDFYSTHFFDPVATNGVRYSFTGAIKEPREVLRGGYLSWVDPTSGIWWQETWFDGDPQPSFRSLGKLNAQDGSIRSQVDRLTAKNTQQAHAGGLRAAQAAGLSLSKNSTATAAKAAQLRSQIDSLIGEHGRTGSGDSRSAGAPGGGAPNGEGKAMRRPPRADRPTARATSSLS
jgi:hypothetical protein